MAGRARSSDAHGRRSQRLALLLVAAALSLALTAGAAPAGADPGALAASSVHKQVRKLSKKVKRTSKRLTKLGKRVSALEAQQGGSELADYAAAAFTPVDESTHNNNADSVCGAFVPSQKGSENKGDLNAKVGSFLTPVVLPDGATINRLTMFANDFSDADAHAFLVRKQIQDGLDPQFDGYEVLGQVNTDGAENGVMREFATPITNGLVNNATDYLYIELVVCDAIEPFAIQVRYTR